MHLKSGVRPSEALKDIFETPDKYAFECATALVALRYKAMMELIGEKDFDRIAGDLRIGPWDQENDAARLWKVRGEAADGSKIAASPETVKKDLKPGDYTYFKNWSVSLAGYKAGWQGENVIFLGDGMYYGHPFGVISGKEIVDYLNEHRRTGNVKSASLLDLRATVDPSVLKHDKIAND
jgi:protein-glutamine gamma-glutamyltransferase